MKSIANEHVAVTVRYSLSYRIRRFIQKYYCKVFGYKAAAQLYYRVVMKRKLNIDNPKTFTEKINWYKLFYCPNDPLIIKCTNKQDVRDFLISLGYEDNLPKIIATYFSPNEINWSVLPQKFALKSSHGCGCNIICSDKNSLDKEGAVKLLRVWQKEEFGYYNAEPHYNLNPNRTIICEKFIESDHLLPTDYKVGCSNGRVIFIQACTERTNKKTVYHYYYRDGRSMTIGESPISTTIDLKLDVLEKVCEISETIATHFPFVRVDFYIEDGRIVISELTFTPSAGLKPDLLVNNGDVELGNLLELPKWGGVSPK